MHIHCSKHNLIAYSSLLFKSVCSSKCFTLYVTVDLLGSKECIITIKLQNGNNRNRRWETYLSWLIFNSIIFIRSITRCCIWYLISNIMKNNEPLLHNKLSYIQKLQYNFFQIGLLCIYLKHVIEVKEWDSTKFL